MAVIILNGNSFYIDVGGTGCEVLPQKCRVKCHKNTGWNTVEMPILIVGLN